jgi:hypothetical protein
MTAVAVRRRAPALVGSPRPRLAPPIPAQSDVAGFRAVASELGIVPMPWQDTAARYLEALAPQKRHLYREVAVLGGRQNGKTTLLRPLVRKRLKEGRRIMHTAQNRELPREVFAMVADDLGDHDPHLFMRRGGRLVMPRFANGQEEIRLANGGRYRIVAPTRGGARGGTNDDVLVDELREMDDFEFIGAAKPTLTASPDPQIVYLSNAGETDSVVLNSVRDRAGRDPRLAYLEWSAGPERAADDPAGWAEANPAIGHISTMLAYLEDEYRTNSLARTLSLFEVEHLCRWQNTTRQILVADEAWKARRVDELPAPVRPALGVSMDPYGTRASAAIAWPLGDERYALRLLYDVTGHPIDPDRLGADLRATARELRVGRVGFDPLTDVALAKFFRRGEPIAGAKYANASARFVTAIESEKLAWHDAEAVGTDLGWTARKPHDESGSFQAVRADDDRPITAALASIRAVWLASQPRPAALPSSAPTAMGF